MRNQAADGGDIGASYALAIISIFKGRESVKEGNVHCQYEQNRVTKTYKISTEFAIYFIWKGVKTSFNPHLLGERPTCCTIRQFYNIRCDLYGCDLEIEKVVKFPY